MTAEGHADDATVCSAISAIMWGLAGMMHNYDGKPDVNTMKMQSGDFDIEITPSVVKSEQALYDNSFEFALVALSQIAKKYPEQIVID